MSKQLRYDGIDVECSCNVVVSWIQTHSCKVWCLWDFWEQPKELLDILDNSIYHIYREEQDGGCVDE